MSVQIELLLLNPAPRVAFGMPIFISRNAALLRKMLRNHGEWWDNPSQWFVYCSRESAQLGLHVEFGHLPNGRRYCDALTPHLGPTWRVVWPIAPKEDDHVVRRAEGVTDLDRAWLSTGDALPVPIRPEKPGVLDGLHGRWFTCDGAIALDMSVMPAAADKCIGAIVTKLLAQPRIFAPIAAHAESCFLFHLDSVHREFEPFAHDIAIEPIRRGRLPKRQQGYLYESNLCFIRQGTAP